MKFQRLLMVSAATLSVVGGATVAHAAGIPSDLMFSAPYVEFGGGLNFSGVSLGDVTDNFSFNATQTSNFGSGGTFYGAVGAELMPGIRGEVQASYRQNSGASFNLTGEGNGTLGVSSSTFMLMANFWKDFDLSDGFSVHVGGGVGFGNQTLTTDGSPTQLSKTGLAAMLGIGADYALTNDMKLTLDYRVSGITGSFARESIASNLNDNFSGVLTTALDQSVTVGLRIPIGN
jgi:opacity protein-like surface antigen